MLQEDPHKRHRNQIRVDLPVSAQQLTTQGDKEEEVTKEEIESIRFLK